MASPSLTALSTACELDPDGGGELLRFTLFEAMADLADRYGPSLNQAVAKAFVDARPGLVRQYVAKRLANEPVEEILAAASVVSKAYDPQERRDARGEWTKTGNDKLDKIAAFVGGGEGSGKRPDARLGDVVGPNSTGYKRLSLAGQALTAASNGQPHIAALGMTAQLAGELGPQAELVLGPALKRTAYRYRGTEKRPDQELQHESRLVATMANNISAGKATDFADPTAPWRAATKANPTPTRKRSGNAPYGLAEYYATGLGADQYTPDQLRLAMVGDYAATKLQPDIPSLHHAQLSLEAGKMPPSTGVIIDRDGDVVSQAQGYNGDHYLPFDLTNLKRLQGGSYVRTRTTGGPTDEDIYTALMTGARQIQVVSHSGVFTVEFDPNVRGARRYSDKARDMVGRYAALLEAVDSGNVMQQGRDFTPEKKAEQRTEAWRSAGEDPVRAGDRLRKIQERDRAELRFTDDSETEADARGRVFDGARQHAAAGGSYSNQSLARDTRDLAHASQAEAAKVYRLDGDGYQAALKALQGEFPYYIRRTDFQTWPEFYDDRNLPRPRILTGGGASDIGYTRHNALAPARVEGRRAAAAKPAAVDAPVAEAAPTATAGVPSIEQLDNSGLEDDLARSLAHSLPALNLIDHGSALPDMEEDDRQALAQPAGTYAIWVLNGKGTPAQQAKWLLNSADPQHIEKLKQNLEWLDATIPRASNADQVQAQFPAVKEAIANLEKVQLVRDPYDKPAGDPVLTAGDKPQVFEDTSPKTLGYRPAAYAAYLRDNPDVADAFTGVAGHNDEQIAELIHKKVGEYKKLDSWGAELADPTDTEAYQNPPYPLEESDAAEAREVNEAGKTHTRYLDLMNLQKAWSIKRGTEVAAVLRGSSMPVMSDPKVQAVTAAKRLSSLSTVVVHGPGSPASIALSKRLLPQRRLVPLR